MILGCHFSIGWNDGIDFIDGMMELILLME